MELFADIYQTAAILCAAPVLLLLAWVPAGLDIARRRTLRGWTLAWVGPFLIGSMVAFVWSSLDVFMISLHLAGWAALFALVVLRLRPERYDPVEDALEDAIDDVGTLAEGGVPLGLFSRRGPRTETGPVASAVLGLGLIALSTVYFFVG